MDSLVFKQPRDSRLVGGTVAVILGSGVLFFTTLVALESFADSPMGILLFMLLSIGMICVGLYFAACTPVLAIDADNRCIRTGKSCLLFETASIERFDAVKEVGIKEAYHAGSRGEQTGTIYAVEIRGAKLLEVPGTSTGHADDAARSAKEIAQLIGVDVNPKFRKVFTGSFKLGKE